jgi:hypothetical protein
MPSCPITLDPRLASLLEFGAQETFRQLVDSPNFASDNLSLPSERMHEPRLSGTKAALCKVGTMTHNCDEDHTFIASQNLLEVHWT